MSDLTWVFIVVFWGWFALSLYDDWRTFPERAEKARRERDGE